MLGPLEELALASTNDADDRQQDVQQVPYRFASHLVSLARGAKFSSQSKNPGGRLLLRPPLVRSEVLLRFTRDRRREREREMR